MSNKYKVLLPLKVVFPDGEYVQGDVFEHTFESPQDEQANLNSGLLEIVPRKYKVVGDSKVAETNPGGVFEKALTMGQEEHLVAAGHIVRVEDDPAAKTAPKKKGE